MSGSTQNNQWIRKWSLVVYNTAASGYALDISDGSDQPGQEQLRIIFNVQQTDGKTPNYCDVKIYNPSLATAMSVIKQYARMTLSAGYLNGRFGVIFDGTIAQFEFGGETAVDTYLHLFAADGDIALNTGTINTTLIGAANTTAGRIGAIAKSLTPFGVTFPDAETAQLGNNLPPSPRGTVLFGMSKDAMDETVGSVYAGSGENPYTWSIQNGVFVLVPSNNAIPDNEVFELNSLTGMIGFPNTTSDGVEVRTLLNPSFAIRRQVQINNKDVNQTLAKTGGQIPGLQLPLYPGPADLSYVVDVSNDGSYLILVVNHIGDSRGNDWYTDLVCLACTPDGIVSTSNSGIPLNPSN